MYRTLVLATLFTFTTLSLHGQEKLSGAIYGGVLFPHNDFNQTDYVGYKRNWAVGINMGYQVGSFIRLRGDINTGLLNGNNATNYYETDIYEASLGADFNLIKLFAPDYNMVKLNIQGGVGMMMYSARLYNRATSQKVVESPIRGVRTFSPNAIVVYGANLSFEITPKLDFTLGYTNRYTDAVDWMDGQKSGDHTDTYGMGQVGFTFYLKKDEDPTKIEIDKKRYNNLLATQDSLGKQLDQREVNQEKLAELEMANEEKSVKIRMLESEIDTLKKNLIAKVDTAITKPAPFAANASAVLAQEQYRVVVASLPTREMAQRWIDKSRLDKSEMVIAYIEDLNTYRVVYKSFDTYPAARKELLSIKPTVSDAWVVKF